MCGFIIQTSDPTYWSIFATALIKSIKVKTELSKRDRDIINTNIQKLENLSHKFISTSFEISQDKTVIFLKEARIGGFSIIGEPISLLSYHVDHLNWNDIMIKPPYKNRVRRATMTKT